MIINRCPYCSGKLIHGYMKTRGEALAWSPNPENYHLWLINGILVRMISSKEILTTSKVTKLMHTNVIHAILL